MNTVLFGGKHSKSRLEVIETHRAVMKQSFMGEHSKSLCPSSWKRSAPQAFVHWTPDAAAFPGRASYWKCMHRGGTL